MGSRTVTNGAWDVETRRGFSFWWLGRCVASIVEKPKDLAKPLNTMMLVLDQHQMCNIIEGAEVFWSFGGVDVIRCLLRQVLVQS